MKHYSKMNMFWVMVVLGLLFAGSAVSAETRVSREELKTLLSGNTAEGKYVKWGTTHKMYFDASGSMRRIDSKNNKENGSWSVNKSGELCIDVRKERCSVVKKRDDGGYNVYRRDVLKFTFDKIVPGNPYNL